MNPAPTAQIIKYVGLDVHAQTIAVAGRTVADKVPAIVLPITALVAGGFEHSVANMCFIPMDIFLREHVAAAGAANHDVLNWMSLARNLAPVTLGNLVGGAGMVGLYLKVKVVFLARVVSILLGLRHENLPLHCSHGGVPRLPDLVHWHPVCVVR